MAINNAGWDLPNHYMKKNLLSDKTGADDNI